MPAGEKGNDCDAGVVVAGDVAVVSDVRELHDQRLNMMQQKDALLPLLLLSSCDDRQGDDDDDAHESAAGSPGIKS